MVILSVKKNGRVYTVERLRPGFTVLRVNRHTEVQSVKCIGPTGLYYDEIAKTVPSYAKNVCILGLAGGTIARRLRERGWQGTITGVENDETMIEIGNLYFDLNTVDEIICEDARNFCRYSGRLFDCVIDDLYVNSNQRVRVDCSMITKAGGLVIRNKWPDSGIETICT